jgi:hypothetical protein
VSQRFSGSDFDCPTLAWTASRLTELRDTPTACAISGRTSSSSRVETPRSIAPQRVLQERRHQSTTDPDAKLYRKSSNALSAPNWPSPAQRLAPKRNKALPLAPSKGSEVS